MLKVSIHAGPLSRATFYNRRDWLDIGYQRLDIMADYKTLLFESGAPASGVRTLSSYPRWSGSIWDLVARCVAVCLTDERTSTGTEVVPDFEPGERARVAFAERISAVIEHHADYGDHRQTRLGTAEIRQYGRWRGFYCAEFSEDSFRTFTTDTFEYRPARLRPAELLMRAALMHVSGQHTVMPPRPHLENPRPVTHGGKSCIPIQRLRNPAKTGVLRWLLARGKDPLKHPDYKEGLVDEFDYEIFLRTAV